MAINILGEVGGGTSKTSSTSLTVTTTAPISAGTLLVIGVVYDNHASTTAAAVTLPAIGGATPTQRLAPLGSGVTTTAGSGIWLTVYSVLTTSAISSGATFTITFGNAVIAKAASFYALDGATHQLRGTIGSGTSTVGTPSAATSGTALVAGDVVVGVMGVESATSPTTDTDTTNGSWSATVGYEGTTGGSAATNVGVYTQAKVVTATGIQTFDPGGGANDAVAAILSFVPVLTVSVSDSGGGTDSLTAGLAREASTADQAGASDAATLVQTIDGQFADSAGGSDTAAVLQSQDVTLADNAAGSDSAAAIQSQVLAFSETAAGSDSSGAASALQAQAADTANATDSVAVNFVARPMLVRSSTTTSFSQNGGATLTIAKPAGLVDGDYLLFTVRNQTPTAPAGGYTNADGFVNLTTNADTDVAAADSGHRVVQFMGKRVTNAAAEPATYTFTLTSGSRYYGELTIVKNVNTTTPLVAKSPYAANAYPSTGNIKGRELRALTWTSTSPCLAIAVAGTEQTAGNANAPDVRPAGWTTIIETATSTDTTVSRTAYDVYTLDVDTGSNALTYITWPNTAATAGPQISHVVLQGIGTAAAASSITLGDTANASDSVTATVTSTSIYKWTQRGAPFVAHRGGLYNTYGEFTVAGFQAALALLPGVAMEISVYRTSDGVWVASHDRTTGRVLSGASLDIPTSLWADISGKTTLVGGNPVARLDDLVAACPAGTVFFIDNKQNVNITAFFDKITALGLDTGNVVNKNYIGSPATMTEAQARGYTTWAYGYDADMAAFASNYTKATWLGFDWGGTQANWNTVIGYGLPSFSHIIGNDLQRDTADSKAKAAGGSNFGYMVSRLDVVTPGIRVTDTANATDSVTTTSSLSYSLSDTAGATDASSSQQSLNLSISDSAGATDVAGLVGPKISTFVESFSAGDLSQWVSYGNPWSAANGRAELVGTYSYMDTDYPGGRFDFTDSSVIVRMAPIGGEDPSGYAGLFVYDQASGQKLMEISLRGSSGGAQFGYRLGGAVYLQTVARAEFYRMGNSAGVYYLDTSTDGTTWTRRVTSAPGSVPPLTFAILALEANAPTGAYWIDDINVPARTQYDTAGATDSVSAVFTLSAGALADSAGGSDTAAPVQTSVRTQADSAGATDSAATLQSQAVAQADTAGCTDSASSVSSVDRTISDSASGADALVLAVERSQSDTAGATDASTSQQSLDRSVADSAGGTDAFTLAVSRTLTDSASGSDTLTVLVSAVTSLADAAGATDALALTVERAQADTAGATDAAASDLAATRSPADSASGTDALALSVARSQDDPAGASDALALQATRSLADSATGSDILTLSASRALADSASGTDAVSLMVTRDLADTADGTDLLSPTASYDRALSDAAGALDEVSTVDLEVTDFDDAGFVTDVVTVVQSSALLAADAADGTDVLDAAFDRDRSAADTADATDASLVQLAADRRVSDTATGADAALAESSRPRAADDAADLSDQAVAEAYRPRDLTDAAGLTDDVSTQVSRQVSVNDPAGAFDALAADLGVPIDLADAAGATDVVALAQSTSSTASDTAGVTDQATTASERPVALSDPAAASDALALTRLYAVDLADASAGSDNLDLTRSRVLAVTDAAAASDEVSVAITYARTASDSIGAADALSLGRQSEKALTDAASGSDTASVTRGPTAFVTDTASASDLLQLAVAVRSVLGDAAGVSDDLHVDQDAIVIPADVAAATDAVSVILSAVEDLADAAAASDSLLVALALAAARTLVDAAGATDVLLVDFARAPVPEEWFVEVTPELEYVAVVDEERARMVALEPAPTYLVVMDPEAASWADLDPPLERFVIVDAQ